MKSNTRTTHHAHPDITPDQARDARAWRYVFDCWEQKRVTAKDGSEEYLRKEQHFSQNRTTR
jgi:hypothetical protein